MTLTTHLQTLHTPLYKKATTHPFLTHAAQGTLPKPLLAQWLSQDRLYAQSYIRFIGALLAKTRLPSNPDAKSTVENRVVDLLIDALVNIRRELGFFADVVGEFGLDLDSSSEQGGGGGGGGGGGEADPNPITHSYIDLFMSASSPATTLLEGMVVLWATEICYLRAWQYAATTSSTSPTNHSGAEEDADGGALRKHFIPNWTSPEFEAFVVRIGDVVDELAGLAAGCENKEDVLGRCAVWWRQVLYLEGGFWPDVSSSS